MEDYRISIQREFSLSMWNDAPPIKEEECYVWGALLRSKRIR